MNEIEIGCDLSYDVRQQTVFLLQITAAKTGHQWVNQESLMTTPQVNIEQCEMVPLGNQVHRLLVEPCSLQIGYRAMVQMTPATDPPEQLNEWTVSQMPGDVLTYLNPSRYCESDVLARFAFEEFGQLPRGFSRVQAICDWVHNHLDYTPGSTTSTTTATGVLLQRLGVCRDYAHLAITLCRGVGIPARYVSGFAVDLQPPDFHGFMEAFLDGAWYLFDPTKLAPVSGLVRIGTGRDAADVSFATIIGQATMTSKSVWANPVAAKVQNEFPAAVSTA